MPKREMMDTGHIRPTPIRSRRNDEHKRLQQVNTPLQSCLREDEFKPAGTRERLLRIIDNRKTTEERLRQALKVESTNTIARSIAHDFNNFLTVILGSITLMKAELGDPDMLKEQIRVIERSVQEAAALARRLFSLGQQHREHLQLTSVNTWLTDMAKCVRNILPNGVTLGLELDSSRFEVLADVSQLNQLLLNLCLNARDAMGESGTIRLSTKMIAGADLQHRFRGVKEQDYVCISVADTGAGMDDNTRKRIFEPFFTTKGPGKGTGLGLSICYRIIKIHAGFIDVESEPGHGTTFDIYLPATTGCS